jgi:hypothetical protein
MERELGVSIDRLKSLEDVGLEEASWENAMYVLSHRASLRTTQH